MSRIPVSFATALLLLSGPAAAAPAAPPAAWTALTASASTDCSGIAGTFENLGERDAGSAYFSTPRRLTDLVLPGYLPDATHLSITFAGADSVRLTGWRDSVAIAQCVLRLDGRTTVCDGTGLSLPASRFENDAMIGTSRQQVRLIAAADGSLIAGLTLTQRGLAYLLVPMWMRATEWYRFRPR